MPGCQAPAHKASPRKSRAPAPEQESQVPVTHFASTNPAAQSLTRLTRILTASQYAAHSPGRRCKAFNICKDFKQSLGAEELPLYRREAHRLRGSVQRLLLIRRLGHRAVEGTGLVEDREQVAETFVAGRRGEVAVLVHEPLQLVEELQAPPGVGGAADAPSGDVAVDGRGMGQHRLVERVRVTGAAGDGGDPGWPFYPRL